MKQIFAIIFLFILYLFSYAVNSDSLLIVNGLKDIDTDFNELQYILKKSYANNQYYLDSLISVNNKSYNRILNLESELKISNNKLELSNKHIFKLLNENERIEIQNKYYYKLIIILVAIAIAAIITTFIYILMYRKNTVSRILKEAHQHSDQNNEILLKMNDFNTLSKEISDFITKSKKKKKEEKKLNKKKKGKKKR